MIPNRIYQGLANDSQLTTLLGGAGRIIESQSVDKRPYADGFFLTVSFEEMLMSGVSAISKGPRTMTIAVHHPFDIDRDFATLTSILNRVDELLLPLEGVAGSDGLHITAIRRQGRGGNQVDEGWKTITRTATYGVLYDEYAA
jgi:hypothetical protein